VLRRLQDQLGAARGAATDDRGRRFAGRAQLDRDAPAVGRGKGAVAEPVDVAQPQAVAGQRRARPDDDAAGLGLQPHHVDRFAGVGAAADTEAAALPHGKVDHPLMAAEHGAVEVHDLARPRRLRAQLLDQPGVGPVRDEADVLAVRLLRYRQPQAPGQRPHRVLVPGAQREAQEVELRARGGEQEIALVARAIDRAAQFGAGRSLASAHVVAGGQGVGTELARGGQQVAELDRLVAADAGNRRLAAHIGVGEVVDHLGAKAALVVQDIMRDAEVVGHVAGVVHVLPGATGAAAPDRGTVVVELQGDADHPVACLRQERRGHRAVDAAGHGDHDPGRRRRLVEAQGVGGGGYGRAHDPEYRPRRRSGNSSLRSRPCDPGGDAASARLRAQ